MAAHPSLPAEAKEVLTGVAPMADEETRIRQDLIFTARQVVTHIRRDRWFGGAENDALIPEYLQVMESVVQGNFDVVEPPYEHLENAAAWVDDYTTRLNFNKNMFLWHLPLESEFTVLHEVRHMLSDQVAEHAAQRQFREQYLDSAKNNTPFQVHIIKLRAAARVYMERRADQWAFQYLRNRAATYGKTYSQYMVDQGNQTSSVHHYDHMLFYGAFLALDPNSDEYWFKTTEFHAEHELKTLKLAAEHLDKINVSDDQVFRNWVLSWVRNPRYYNPHQWSADYEKEKPSSLRFYLGGLLTLVLGGVFLLRRNERVRKGLRKLGRLARGKMNFFAPLLFSFLTPLVTMGQVAGTSPAVPPTANQIQRAAAQNVAASRPATSQPYNVAVSQPSDLARNLVKPSQVVRRKKTLQALIGFSALGISASTLMAADATAYTLKSSPDLALLGGAIVIALLIIGIAIFRRVAFKRRNDWIRTPLVFVIIYAIQSLLDFYVPELETSYFWFLAPFFYWLSYVPRQMKNRKDNVLFSQSVLMFTFLNLELAVMGEFLSFFDYSTPFLLIILALLIFGFTVWQVGIQDRQSEIDTVPILVNKWERVLPFLPPLVLGGILLGTKAPWTLYPHLLVLLVNSFVIVVYFQHSITTKPKQLRKREKKRVRGREIEQGDVTRRNMLGTTWGGVIASLWLGTQQVRSTFRGIVSWFFISHDVQSYKEFIRHVEELKRKNPGKKIIIGIEDGTGRSEIRAEDPTFLDDFTALEMLEQSKVREMLSRAVKRSHSSIEPMLEEIRGYLNKGFSPNQINARPDYIYLAQHPEVGYFREKWTPFILIQTLRWGFEEGEALKALYESSNENDFYTHLNRKFKGWAREIIERDRLFGKKVQEVRESNPGAIIAIHRGDLHYRLAQEVDHGHDQVLQRRPRKRPTTLIARTDVDMLSRVHEGRALPETSKRNRNLLLYYPATKLLGAILSSKKTRQGAFVFDAASLDQQISNMLSRLSEGEAWELTQHLQENVLEQERKGNEKTKEEWEAWDKQFVTVMVSWLKSKDYLTSSLEKLIPVEYQTADLGVRRRWRFQGTSIQTRLFSSRLYSVLFYLLMISLPAFMVPASGAYGAQPVRAVEKAPENSSATIEGAINLVRTKVSNLSAEEIFKKYVRTEEKKDQLVSWVVAHQLLVVGIDEDKIKVLLDQLSFDTLGRPYFRRGSEGHPAQYLKTLVDIGVPLNRRFVLQNENVIFHRSLSALIRDLSNRYRWDRIGDKDPSWIIEATLQVDNQLSRPLRNYISEGIISLYGPQGVPRRYRLVEGGKHFHDALSKVFAKYDPMRAQLAGAAQTQLDGYKTILDNRSLRDLINLLREGTKSLEPTLKAFRENPNVETAIALKGRFEDLGHVIEIMLHPKGYFLKAHASNYEKELDRAAETLASNIQLWFSEDEEYKEARQKAGDLIMKDNIRFNLALEGGEFQHAGRSLQLYEDWIKEKLKAGGAFLDEPNQLDGFDGGTKPMNRQIEATRMAHFLEELSRGNSARALQLVQRKVGSLGLNEFGSPSEEFLAMGEAWSLEILENFETRNEVFFVFERERPMKDVLAALFGTGLQLDKRFTILVPKRHKRYYDRLTRQLPELDISVIPLKSDSISSTRTLSSKRLMDDHQLNLEGSVLVVPGSIHVDHAGLSRYPNVVRFEDLIKYLIPAFMKMKINKILSMMRTIKTAA